MQKLWRKTKTLLSRNPILWLPVLCADFLSFCLKQLQRLLTHQTVRWLTERNSVFGSTTYEQHDFRVYTKAAVLATCLQWGTSFLSLCLYTAAMIMTARVTQNIVQPDRLDKRFSLASATTCSRSFFQLNVKILGMLALAWISFSWTTSLIAVHSQGHFIGNPWVWGWTLLISGGVAYIITPSALSHLRRTINQFPVPKAIQVGRVWAVLTVVASFVTGVIAVRAEEGIAATAFFHNAATYWVINVIGSLLTACPYVFLFVAFATIIIETERSAVEIRPDNG